MATRRRLAGAVLIGGSLIAACQPSTNAPTTDPGGAISGAGLTGQALNVTVLPDLAAAATATVGSAGGVLHTTAGDGSRFTLEIPRNALIADTLITMMPIAEIPDLPLKGGFGAGVLFEPDGLRLLEPAKLTIEPARPIPADKRLAFGSSQGQDFHLVPLVAHTDKIQLYVVHFSDDGVGNGDVGDVASVQPANSQAQFQQQLAEALAEARVKFPDKPLAEVVGKLIEQANATYEASLKKKLKGGCLEAADAAVEILAYGRQEALLSTGSDRAGDIYQSQDFTDAAARCRAEWQQKLEEACASGDMGRIQYALVRVLAGNRTDESSMGSAVIDYVNSANCRIKGWTGTITFTREKEEHFSDSTPLIRTTTSTTERISQKVTIQQTIENSLGPPNVSFKMKAIVTGQYAYSSDVSRTPLVSPPECGPWNGESESLDELNGQGSGEAIVILLGGNGVFSGVVESNAEYEATGASRGSGRAQSASQCNMIVSSSFSNDHSQTEALGGIGFFENAGVSDPNVLKGQMSVPENGGKTTIAWDLTRER